MVPALFKPDWSLQMPGITHLVRVCFAEISLRLTIWVSLRISSERMATRSELWAYGTLIIDAVAVNILGKDGCVSLHGMLRRTCIPCRRGT